jgi:hypothetical protein
MPVTDEDAVRSDNIRDRITELIEAGSEGERIYRAEALLDDLRTMTKAVENYIERGHTPERLH